MNCAIDGCEKPAGRPGTAKGLCATHYHRLRRTGNPLTTLKDLKPKASPICSVEACGKARWARGLCSMHLMRLRTTGDVGGADPLTARRVGTCRLGGCGRPVRHATLSLCQGHYLRLLRHGDPLAGGRTPQAGAVCLIDGCGRKHYARDLCRAHWGAIARRRRTERDRRAAGSCTPAQLAARVAYYGGKCHICGAPGNEIDHVKPLAAGGCNWPANLRPACKPCNSRKGATWRGTFGHHAPLTDSEGGS